MLTARGDKVYAGQTAWNLCRVRVDNWTDIHNRVVFVQLGSPIIRGGQQQARRRVGAGPCERGRGPSHEPAVHSERDRRDENDHPQPERPTVQHHQRCRTGNMRTTGNGRRYQLRRKSDEEKQPAHRRGSGNRRRKLG